MDLWNLDVTDLAHLIRVGQASSREAVAACLARMDAVNPKLNAVVRRFDALAVQGRRPRPAQPHRFGRCGYRSLGR